MNCCLWIVLLLACRGNCNHGCVTCCSPGCNQRNNGCGCESRCDEERMSCPHTHDDCDMHHSHMDCRNEPEYEDCGCMREEEANIYDNRMTYETFGCQENGIPCPPPVPGNYTR